MAATIIIPLAGKDMEEVTVCPYCEMPTVELFVGDEGATYCPDECGCLEGAELKIKYECPKCRELKDEPKCDCK